MVNTGESKSCGACSSSSRRAGTDGIRLRKDRTTRCSVVGRELPHLDNSMRPRQSCALGACKTPALSLVRAAQQQGAITPLRGSAHRATIRTPLSTAVATESPSAGEPVRKSVDRARFSLVQASKLVMVHFPPCATLQLHHLGKANANVLPWPVEEGTLASEPNLCRARATDLSSPSTATAPSLWTTCIPVSTRPKMLQKGEKMFSSKGKKARVGDDGSRMFPVEVGSRTEGDKELRSVGVRSRVGHRENASPGEAELGVLRERKGRSAWREG